MARESWCHFAGRLQRGDPTEAVKILQEVLRRATKALGPDHMMTLHVQRILARALAEGGRLDEAELLCKQTLDKRLHSRTGRNPTAPPGHS